MLEIIAYGATSEVGRSCFLLSEGDRNIVLDAGVRIQPRRSGQRAEVPSGINEHLPELDAVILSHAHLDHSGYIPALFKSENQPTLHLTKPTVDLVQILWKDHLKIEGSTHYSYAEIDKANRNMIGHEYNRSFRVVDGVTAQFLDAGHVLGSASILIDWDGQKILYTGDINNQKTTFHDAASLSGLNGDELNVLIIETTNSQRTVPSRKQVYSDFTKSILKTFSHGGKVLTPSFALGRSQELQAFFAMQFNGFLHKNPVYVDGMILGMNTIHEKFFSRYWVSPRILKWAQEFGYPSPFDHEGIHPVEPTKKGQRRGELRAKLAKTKRRRMIILSTSGMMEGGPIHSYLRVAGSDQSNLLAVVGYQATETMGREILNGVS